MTIREIASGGGIAFVVLTLVQIAPVKLNPWTWLARAIGRAINGDVLRKLDETRKILDDHIKTDDARNADFHRSKILRFNNELLRDIPHTQEDFIEILHEIDLYEKYCDTHPEYENNRATHAVANIKRVYDRRPAVERTTAPPTKRGQAEPPEDRVFKAGSLGGPLYLFRRVRRGRVGRRPRRFTAWRFPCLRWNTNGNGHRLLFVESKGGKRCENQKGEPGGNGGNAR